MRLESGKRREKREKEEDDVNFDHGIDDDADKSLSTFLQVCLSLTCVEFVHTPALYTIPHA